PRTSASDLPRVAGTAIALSRRAGMLRGKWPYGPGTAPMPVFEEAAPMKRARTLLVLTALAVLMMLVPVAWGADVEGKIKSVDPSGKIVTLDDGTQLTIPQIVAGEMKVLQPGASVKASYEEKDGQKVATSFMVMPAR